MQNSNHYLKVDRPFQFIDVESRCKLEGLNKVSSDVYGLPLTEPKLKSKKLMCMVDLDFVYDSQLTIECTTKETKT